jgi:hypothetical protein
VQAGVLRVDAQVLGDLHAQFARRHDDDAAQAGLAAAQLVEHRQAERGRLAAAGLAEADQFEAGRGSWGWHAPGSPSAFHSRRREDAAQDGLLEPEGSENSRRMILLGNRGILARAA